MLRHAWSVVAQQGARQAGAPIRHAFLGGRGAFPAGVRSMFIEAHPTPNVNSLKFHPGKPVLPHGTMDFPSARAGMQSPLAKALFRVDGVSSVFFGMDFVTVTKNEDDLSWAELKPEIFAAIMDFYASGSPVVSDAADLPDITTVNEDDSEVVQLIKELLDTRIRPAVQDDGGDINFVSFNEESGVVVVQLQGACSTCASSKVTLKSGVENMLKHYVPEVHEVIAEDLEVDDADPVQRRQKEFLAEMTGDTYKTPAC